VDLLATTGENQGRDGPAKEVVVSVLGRGATTQRGDVPAQRPRHTYVEPAPEGSLGAKIRELRLARGWTQAFLGEQIDVAQAQISAWERGEIRMPDPAAMVRMAEVFGVDRRVLLDLTPWQGATRRLESVPPPGSLVIPGAKDRPLLIEVVELACDLDDAELESVLHRMDHLLARRVDGAQRAAAEPSPQPGSELADALRAVSA